MEALQCNRFKRMHGSQSRSVYAVLARKYNEAASDAAGHVPDD